MEFSLSWWHVNCSHFAKQNTGTEQCYDTCHPDKQNAGTEQCYNSVILTNRMLELNSATIPVSWTVLQQLCHPDKQYAGTEVLQQLCHPNKQNAGTEQCYNNSVILTNRMLELNSVTIPLSSWQTECWNWTVLQYLCHSDKQNAGTEQYYHTSHLDKENAGTEQCW